MKSDPDPPLSPTAPLPPRWNFGYFYLLVCLVAGCWGIILNRIYARKPPTPEELPWTDALAEAVSIAAVAMALPILYFAWREKRPWRYMVMAGFELFQFGLVRAAQVALLLPEIMKKQADPTTIPMPPALFWIMFALSIVEALVAVGCLCLPTAPPPPASEPGGEEP